MIESFDLLTGETRETYTSSTALAEAGYSKGAISEVAAGRRRQYKGFGWRRVDRVPVEPLRIAKPPAALRDSKHTYLSNDYPDDTLATFIAENTTTTTGERVDYRELIKRFWAAHGEPDYTQLTRYIYTRYSIDAVQGEGGGMWIRGMYWRAA